LAKSHQIHAPKGSAAQSGYLLQFRDGHLGVFVVEFQGFVTRSTARIAPLTTGLLSQLFNAKNTIDQVVMTSETSKTHEKQKPYQGNGHKGKENIIVEAKKCPAIINDN